MNSKTILAALVAITIGGASAIPALASDNSKALNQMAMQMYMQQQANQQAQVYNQQVTNANQAQLAEAAWQAQNGSFPYKDQYGRAYGPYGYSNNGNVGYGNVGYGNSFLGNLLPIGYNTNVNQCAPKYNSAYNNGYYNNGYYYNNGRGIGNGLSNGLNRLSSKLNRTIRYW